MPVRPALLIVAALLAPAALPAQQPELRATHVKREVMIPMRDGVRLFTSILIPRDTSRHPMLLRRTPYSCGPYGAEAYPLFVPNQMRRHLAAGYIVVCQDVRGRYMSEGEYANVRPYIPVKTGPTDIDETTDTWDTVDWLVKNLEEDNGRVGISAISYPGFYTWMGTIDAHPAVVATSPQAPVSKWMAGDDFFHNGAFLLPHAFDFCGGFGWPRPAPKSEPDRPLDPGTPDEYEFFLELGPLSNANERFFHHQVAFRDTLTMNGRWNDFWAARDILPHLRNLRPATLVVGGWFDTENLYGALNSYRANERQSPGATNSLVMGPWFHGQWNAMPGDSLGAIAWGSRTSEFYTDSIEGPFFDHWLKGAPAPDLPEAWMFDTGAKQWWRFAARPFRPDTPTSVAFTLQDAFHTFRAGHRIMVQIQSSWFPMVDRNPGVFNDIFQAVESDYRRTTQRVWRSPVYVSALTVRRLR